MSTNKEEMIFFLNKVIEEIKKLITNYDIEVYKNLLEELMMIENIKDFIQAH